MAERVRFLHGDLYAPLPPGTRFDFIVSNPPYVRTADIVGGLTFEPRLALDGGADGLDAYRRIAAQVANFLAPEGCLLIEVGCSQAEAVSALLGAQGLSVAADGVRLDLAGRPRVVVAEGSIRPKMRLESCDVRGRFVATE